MEDVGSGSKEVEPQKRVDEVAESTLCSSHSPTSLPDEHSSHHADDANRNPGSDDDALRQINTNASNAEPQYSVFTKHQKRFIVFMASWGGFFSPVSATIYLPALNALTKDLDVSNSLINLTLTSYMIFQGLAPAFMGSFADAVGRRPAYIVCFVIYVAANIGLASQHRYAALFVLRCLQSTGSSATIAMASAVVSDIATPSERGKYMGFSTAGSLLGPAIGPVIGGLLTEYLSWRAIFWFLAIFAGAFLTIFSVFFPETARSIVGNGSVTPTGLNTSFVNYIAARKASRAEMPDERTSEVSSEAAGTHRSRIRFPNPCDTVKILFDKSNALLLFSNGFLFAAFYDITATIPSQFSAIYGYNDFQIGLCYIPLGAGSLVASLINGQLLDRHFARWCQKLNVPIKKGRDQDLRNFPIEKARLGIALPALYVSVVFLLIFGWILHFHGPVAGLLIVMFLTTLSTTMAFNCTSTLLIDLYPGRAATATAANNLVRCLLGAAATGLIIPMIEGMKIGWTFTFLGLFLLASSPMLWILRWKGMQWRQSRIAREAGREGRRRSEVNMGNEKGNVNAAPSHAEHTITPQSVPTSQDTTVAATLGKKDPHKERLKM